MFEGPVQRASSPDGFPVYEQSNPLSHICTSYYFPLFIYNKMLHLHKDTPSPTSKEMLREGKEIRKVETKSPIIASHSKWLVWCEELCDLACEISSQDTNTYAHISLF